MEKDSPKLLKCPKCGGSGQEWVHDARLYSLAMGYKKPVVLGSYATCFYCGGIGLVAEVTDETGALWHQPLLP